MLQIFEPFFMLTLLIVLGAALNYLDLLDLDLSRRLSRLVVRVTFPALLFLSMYRNINLTSLHRGWIFTLIGLGTSILLAITAHYSGLRLGLQGKTHNTFQILCTNGNNIFLPVPIILALYGTEYLVYAFLFELGAGLFYWSYGVSHFRSGPRFNLKRLFNLNMLALILGLIAGLLEVKLPQPIIGALDLVGNITIGSAMLIIGALVFNLLRIRLRWRTEVWGVMVHRFILSPLVGVIFLSLVKLPVDLQSILMLMLSMPPLVTTALVAANFDADEELATLGVVVPTLLSFIVVPLLLLWQG